MKAVILAGGSGKRLRKLVMDKPKSMAPVLEKAFLQYQIEQLKKYNIIEIVLYVGYLANQIKSYFKDGAKFGVNIRYVAGKKPLGTADARYVAGELVNKFQLEREALPAIALTTDSSVLTSIANDYDYSRIFAHQVKAWAKEGDVVIGISTSGNSANVIEAVKVAREKGAKTVGFTGRGGGKLAKLVDLVVRIPSDETPRIQESHITIFHIICYLVETELFGNEEQK